MTIASDQKRILKSTVSLLNKAGRKANKIIPQLSLIPNQVLKSIKNRFITFILGDSLLFWSVGVVRNRLWYKFNALRCGVSINTHPKSINADNFRRNIHRLEKGLSYPQPKAIFADGYILPTVYFLKEDRTENFLDDRSRRWGEAVLDLYFQTCEHSGNVAKAYELYLSLKPNNTHKDWVPYSIRSRPELSIDYNSLHQLALRRRSIRFYLEQKVEPQIIKKAMKIAALSPSACNRQSFKFLFFNESDIVKQISNVPFGIVGYEVPSIVIVIGSYKGYFDERDINAPIIDSSLAVMSFLFALESLSLSSVCVNWANIPEKEEQIRELISLEDDEFIVMLIGVGYPDPEGKIPYSAKKEVNDLIFVNQRIKNRAMTEK